MKLMTPIPAAALTMLLTACATNALGTHQEVAISTGASAMHSSAPAMRASTSNDGIVTGTFTRVGGPLLPGGKQPIPVPLTGTVIFSAGHHRTLAVRIGKTGRFSVALPAGTYSVTGRSPSLGGLSASGALTGPPCGPPAPVTVASARTVHVSVVCPVP
jgi:hypothetical protein